MAGWKTWKDVPLAEANQLFSWADEWDLITGGQVQWTQAELLMMANAGVMSMLDFGEWMHDHAGTAGNKVLATMPWAQFGLGKDAYENLATTYATIYEKLTGQTISAAALHQAFLTPNLATGGMFSGSQYEQQLMADINIQKQFGWIKYGMDFSQWQQQKLQLHTAYGRDISDSEAATILQYNRPAQGASVAAVGRPAQATQPSPAQAGQSIVR